MVATLVTHHQPLLSILSPTKGMPSMTSARLQRYALFLSGMDFEITFRNTSRHANADALSLLPMEETYDKDADVIDPMEAFHVGPTQVTRKSLLTIRDGTNFPCNNDVGNQSDNTCETSPADSTFAARGNVGSGQT